MQLSLAGNPLCGPTTSAAEGKGEEREGQEEGEGEYVVKVRSLFPGLKVRDGKRILMKKSHTYYDNRGGEEGGAAANDVSGSGGRRKPGHPSPVGGPAGVDANSDGDGRRKPIEGEKKKRAKSPKSKEARVERGAPASGDVRAQIAEQEVGSNDGGSKESRKRKKKAARAAAADFAAEGKGETDAAMLGKADKKAAQKRRREAEARTERRSRSSVGTAVISVVSPDDAAKSRRKQLRRSEESATGSSVVETAVDTVGTAAVSTQKATKTKKKKSKSNHDRNETSRSSVGSSVGKQQEDPYSSSDELPIPGRQPKKSAAAAALPVGGDRESGVVSVIMNKKRKGAMGAAAKPWQGEAADAGGFSFDAIVEARGEKESIGLGSGVSAWDT